MSYLEGKYTTFYASISRPSQSTRQNQTAKVVRVAGYQIAGGNYCVPIDLTWQAEQTANCVKLKWSKKYLKAYDLIVRGKYDLMV